MPFYPHLDDEMSLYHDITNQAAAGPHLAQLYGESRPSSTLYSISSSSSEDDASSYSHSSGFMSRSSSLTSVSTASSGEISTRPSSCQGWTFDGVWDVGELSCSSKIEPRAHVEVQLGEEHGDPAEAQRRNGPFLVAQYVAQQLRADLDDDFTPWRPSPELPSPVLAPMPATSLRLSFEHAAIGQGLGLSKLEARLSSRVDLWRAPDMNLDENSPPQLPTVPSIMVIAPSSELTTPETNRQSFDSSYDLLSVNYSPRARTSSAELPKSSKAWALNAFDDSEKELDEDDLVLSVVKELLQTSQKVDQIGWKSRMLGVLRMRR